jgi:hypothetical protein
MNTWRKAAFVFIAGGILGLACFSEESNGTGSSSSSSSSSGASSSGYSSGIVAQGTCTLLNGKTGLRDLATKLVTALKADCLIAGWYASGDQTTVEVDCWENQFQNTAGCTGDDAPTGKASNGQTCQGYFFHQGGAKAKEDSERVIAVLNATLDMNAGAAPAFISAEKSNAVLHEGDYTTKGYYEHCQCPGGDIPGTTTSCNPPPVDAGTDAKDSGPVDSGSSGSSDSGEGGATDGG